MMEEIDSGAIVMLIESNWDEFVEYSGGEGDAEKTLKALKAYCGMD